MSICMWSYVEMTEYLIESDTGLPVIVLAKTLEEALKIYREGFPSNINPKIVKAFRVLVSLDPSRLGFLKRMFAISEFYYYNIRI